MGVDFRYALSKLNLAKAILSSYSCSQNVYNMIIYQITNEKYGRIVNFCSR